MIPVLVFTVALGAADVQRILVLDASGEEPTDEGRTFTSFLASQLKERFGVEVVTQGDVVAALDHRATRGLLGCEDDSKCLAALTAELRAGAALKSSLAKVGETWVVSLALVDPNAVGAAGRVAESFRSADAAMAEVPALLARVLGRAEAKAKKFQLPEGAAVSFAVFDLKGSGVEAEVVANLTQILSNELRQIEGASVISRDDIVAMLELQANKDLFGCSDDDSCLAEIGGALGVDKLVVGQVGRIAQSYVISLRLLDARAAHVDNRLTEWFRGAEDQLIYALRKVARDLLGIEGTGTGRLALSANHNGASAFVDSNAVGELPLPPLADLAAGRHEVRVELDGYFPWSSEVFVEPNETNAVWANLEEEPKSWYEKWWVWTVVGVVAAGSTTAIILATRPEPTPLGTGAVTIE